MPNPENIVKHQFPKGKSGNPKGKPKGAISLTKAVKKFLIENAKDGESYETKLAKATVLRAIARSDVLVKEIWERTDGKVKDNLDISGEFSFDFDDEQLNKIFKRRSVSSDSSSEE